MGLVCAGGMIGTFLRFVLSLGEETGEVGRETNELAVAALYERRGLR